MLALFLLVVFGLGMSYFATQNTGLVHIMFGSYVIQGVPLYIIAIGALLLGILISWLINIVGMLSSSFAIRGKVIQIKNAHEVINKLQQQNHELEIEIASLKAEINTDEPVITERKTINEIKPSFFHKLAHQGGNPNDNDTKIEVAIK